MGNASDGDQGRPAPSSGRGWLGAHLVTLTLREPELLFGQVVDGRMVLDEPGTIVGEEWRRLPTLVPQVRLDEFTVMPNHIHGIIRLGEVARGKAGRRRGRPPRRRGSGEMAVLGAAINQFKAVVTRRINALRGRSGPLWQAGYRDIPIEDEHELAAQRAGLSST